MPRAHHCNQAGRGPVRQSWQEQGAEQMGLLKGLKAGRIGVVAATLAYTTGLLFSGAPAAHSIGGLCNGEPASHTWLDASFQPGPATIEGTNGDDTIVGSDGDDTIDARGGDDYVCGGPGNDDINGGHGDDDRNGDNGDDGPQGGHGTAPVARAL